MGSSICSMSELCKARQHDTCRVAHVHLCAYTVMQRAPQQDCSAHTMTGNGTAYSKIQMHAHNILQRTTVGAIDSSFADMFMPTQKCEWLNNSTALSMTSRVKITQCCS